VKQNVELTTLDGEHLGLDTVVEAEQDALGNCLSRPVLGVAHEGSVRLGGVFLETEGSCAVETALEIAGIVRRENDGIVVVRRHQIGEASVRRIEMKLDRVIPSRLSPTLREHPREHRQGDRPVRRIGEAIHGRGHIGGAEHVPVVKLDVAADPEGPDASVRVRLPALRQRRPQIEIGIRHGEILADLTQQADASRVSDGERVDDSCRHGHADGEERAQGASSLGCAHRADRLGARGAGRESVGERRREPEHRGITQKLAPPDPPGEVFVDRGILHGRAAATDGVGLIHAPQRSMLSLGEKTFAVIASLSRLSSGPKRRSSTTGATWARMSSMKG